jgi:hypothetical protein
VNWFRLWWTEALAEARRQGAERTGAKASFGLQFGDGRQASVKSKAPDIETTITDVRIRDL